jgi:hypothetical protein
LAAIRTLYLDVPGLFVNGGQFHGDPTKPTELPTVPTQFGGPYNVVPRNGSYLFEPPEDGAQQGLIPWICIDGAQQYNRDRADDDSGVLLECSISIRSRVSAAHGDAGGPMLAKFNARMRAECLTQAGLYALQRGLGQSCRALDPAGAFGYAAGGFVDSIAVHEAMPSSQAAGQNQTVVDAVGSIRFYARLYEQGRSA